MYGDYRVIDADCHVIEPHDLWERYMDPELRAQAPKILWDNPARLYGPV